LKAFEQKRKVIINDIEMSHVIKETREDIGLRFYDVFTSIQRELIDFVAAIRKWGNKLLFEGEFADRKHEEDIAEGDVYKIIKEVREATISIIVSAAMSRTMFAEISIAVIGETSKEKAETEKRGTEESN
jgi:hypothetical protein